MSVSPLRILGLMMVPFWLVVGCDTPAKKIADSGISRSDGGGDARVLDAPGVQPG